MARPAPDSRVVGRAYELLRAAETPMERYLREEWEAAIAGVRVALDASRRLWPNERDLLDLDTSGVLEDACSTLAVVYARLDGLADDFLGEQMVMALHGDLTMEELDELTNPGKEKADVTSTNAHTHPGTLTRAADDSSGESELPSRVPRKPQEGTPGGPHDVRPGPEEPNRGGHGNEGR